MSAAAWLQQLASEKKVEALDMAVAQQLFSLSGGTEQNIYWLTALLSYQHRAGHVCIDLERPPRFPFDQRDCPWKVPSLAELEQLCSDSSAISTAAVQADGTTASLVAKSPLVLDGSRLYLRRHWLCEQRISATILRRCKPLDWSPTALSALHGEASEKIFSSAVTTPHIAADTWQKAAALNCALHQFGVITGGPGTGKTWTVTRMLALHLMLAQEQKRELGGNIPDGKSSLPRIAMAAPTGKAAARLTEALQSALPSLAIDEDLRAALPDEAVTLHRLLAMGITGQPGYHGQRTLPFDVIVVDEASMIDLGLMGQLVDALDDSAALYLVGDRDQLASVQAGSVFADVCGNAENIFTPDVANRLQQAGCAELPVDVDAASVDSAVVRLQKVHRFSAQSAIAVLAEASRSNNVEIVATLKQSEQTDLQWLDPNSADIVARMLQHYEPLVCSALQGEEADVLLKQFSQFRALAATRRGPLGVEQLNAALEHLLQRKFGFAIDGWFPGKAVLLKHNDWNLRLFNGDIGIAVMVAIDVDASIVSGTASSTFDNASKKHLRIAFPANDGGIRLIAPSRLPAFESAWAMTIHKSQGSEFDQVLLVLPSEDSPVLTRELLYTGITRAKKALVLAASDEQLTACLQRPVYRASGLSHTLRL